MVSINYLSRISGYCSPDSQHLFICFGFNCMESVSLCMGSLCYEYEETKSLPRKIEIYLLLTHSYKSHFCLLVQLIIIIMYSGMFIRWSSHNWRLKEEDGSLSAGRDRTAKYRLSKLDLHLANIRVISRLHESSKSPPPGSYITIKQLIKYV